MLVTAFAIGSSESCVIFVFPTLRKRSVFVVVVVLLLLLLLPLVVPFYVDYLDYECAWSLLGGAGVLASPFQAMHTQTCNLSSLVLFKKKKKKKKTFSTTTT